MRPRVVVLLVLAGFFLASVAVWAPHGFLRPNDRAIGEAYSAYIGAQNFDLYGFRFAGLQDASASPNPADHPVLYVHHPNFGLYVSHALYQAGVTSLATQNALSIVGSVLGLALAYAFARRVTGSEWFALGFTILLAANVEFIVNWSFNIHRAFTYASVFGTLYALHLWGEAGFVSRVWGAVTFAVAVTLIGTDYMYYFWTMFAALAMCALFFDRRTAVRGAVAIILIFGAIFALRQLQVAVGIGPTVWAGDFVYQVLNRLGLSSLYPVGWLDQTTAFYKTHGVLNPGFSGYVALHERAYHLVVATGEGVLYALGDLAPNKRLALAVGTVLGGATAWCVYREGSRDGLSRTARFSLMFFVPCIVMALAFPALFVLWNRAFLLPHICAAAWVATTFSALLRELPILRQALPVMASK